MGMWGHAEYVVWVQTYFWLYIYIYICMCCAANFVMQVAVCLFLCLFCFGFFVLFRILVENELNLLSPTTST